MPIKFLRNAVPMLALLALSSVSHAAPATTLDQRLAVLKPNLVRDVAVTAARMSPLKPVITLRDLPNSALAIMLLGQDSHVAESYLRQLFSHQNMDPKSPDFGSLPWAIGPENTRDENSVEFSMQSVGPVLIEYRARFTTGLVDDLKPHIEAAIAAMRRRDVETPKYTNVFLTRAESMILCGEAVGDKGAATEGYGQMKQWIDYTRANGIHEYDSPDDYAVDLNTLGAGYRDAAQPQGKAMFRAALDYFWTDICANYFAGRGDLAGAHCRDYDQLGESAALNNYLYLAGLRADPDPQRFGPQDALMLDSFQPGGYIPAAKIVALASVPERVVKTIWNQTPERDLYDYVTPNFAIGSSVGNYCPQDKQINIELPAKRVEPAITVVADDTDQPYGKLETKDSSNHVKPHHLALNPVCVQSKNVLLALVGAIPPTAQTTTLSTNVILPASADEIRIDGQKADASHEFAMPGHIGSIVVVRDGSGAVAIRVFHAEGFAGKPPTISLKADPVGLRYDAARLAIYHYAGDNRRLGRKSMKVGLLFIAGVCKTAADEAALVARAKAAVIDDVATSSDWSVTAKVSGQTLTASADLTGKTQPVRTVNGVSVKATKALTVNDVDYAAAILAPAVAASATP